MRNFVMNQYRASLQASPQEMDGLRATARNYYRLVSDTSERGKLHELDGGAENKLGPKEMSRRAAARAGLSLPVEHMHDA